jgi:hypothetical protein
MPSAVRRPSRFSVHFAVIAVFAAGLISPVPAQAHRSGCHRWHSCPSDSGSYACGDLGYRNFCPDATPRRKKVVHPLARSGTSSSEGTSGRVYRTHRLASATPAPHRAVLHESLQVVVEKPVPSPSTESRYYGASAPAGCSPREHLKPEEALKCQVEPAKTANPGSSSTSH